MNDRSWVATRKGLFEFRRRDGCWRIARHSFIGEPVSMLLAPTPQSGRMLAALNLGHFGVKVHASDDAGQTWREVATPTYPAQPEAPPGDAPGVPWKLVQIWSMEVANGTVWAGTLPGGLFRSADFGESWSLVDSLWTRVERAEWMGGGYDVPGIHSICPHPRRAGEVLLGISCGGAWRTQDDAAHWALAARGMRADFMPPQQADDQNVQDPHLIVRCKAQPERLWCQHHNGIWRSDDNAASWLEVTDVPVSNFGFAVAVHPEQGDTAWFVPAIADQTRIPKGGALVVNRTLDGGRSFETLGRGLPGSDCYDLMYRHGLALAPDGRHLMMGSTTGSLWASDDSGESWSMAAAHLPPIHAIRFG